MTILTMILVGNLIIFCFLFKSPLAWIYTWRQVYCKTETDRYGHALLLQLLQKKELKFEYFEIFKKSVNDIIFMPQGKILTFDLSSEVYDLKIVFLKLKKEIQETVKNWILCCP